jgi:large subunit ribosomal protein L35
MPKQKTRKAIIKRFKFTKTGKVLRRLTGQDHYLAKRSAKSKRNRRKWVELSKPETKAIQKLLNA